MARLDECSPDLSSTSASQAGQLCCKDHAKKFEVLLDNFLVETLGQGF